jgi:hypothetical protein
MMRNFSENLLRPRSAAEFSHGQDPDRTDRQKKRRPKKRRRSVARLHMSSPERPILGAAKPPGSLHFVLTYDGQPAYMVSLVELKDGNPLGPSRDQWVERMRSKWALPRRSSGG